MLFFLLTKKDTVTVTASIVTKSPQMASEKVALQRWTDVSQHFQNRYLVSHLHVDITGHKHILETTCCQIKKVCT